MKELQQLELELLRVRRKYDRARSTLKLIAENTFNCGDDIYPLIAAKRLEDLRTQERIGKDRRFKATLLGVEEKRLELNNSLLP